jgi:hypothetical protein
MPNKPSKQAAIWSLAGGAITAIAGIATTSTSKPIGVILLVIGAIVLIFGAMFVYAIKSDGTSKPAPRRIRLDPAKLATDLDDKQHEILDIALPGVASEVANVVGIPVDLVRANLFAKLPGSNRLGMVQDLWYQMNDKAECTIQMDVGKGSAGLAFQSRNINRAIWKDGWGQSDLGDDIELAKVNPELRWILSTPVFGSADPAPKLVLNVDGLTRTPSADQLAEAIGHLPRFASVIARALDL